MDKRQYPSVPDPRAGGVHIEVIGASDNMGFDAGEIALDGSNPTIVATGLDTVTSVVVILKKATSPGDDPVGFTVDYGGAIAAGSFEIYAWKHDGTDPTLVASTDTGDVSWFAQGTIIG